MALHATYPIFSGQFFLWNAEYQTHAAYHHTVAQVLVVGLDIREDVEEQMVCYVVRGGTPKMTSCSIGQFRNSCTPDTGPPWATPDEVQAAIATAQTDIKEAEIPGVYAFLDHQLLHTAAQALKKL